MDDDAGAVAAAVKRPRDLHPPRVVIMPGKAGAVAPQSEVEYQK